MDVLTDQENSAHHGGDGSENRIHASSGRGENLNSNSDASTPGLVDRLSGTLGRLTRGLTAHRKTGEEKMDSVVVGGGGDCNDGGSTVNEGKEGVNDARDAFEDTSSDQRKPGTIAWSSDKTSFTCAWNKVAYRNSRDMEDRWEATDGSMRGVVMGDIVMASGCDGKWLTVDVPFSEQGDSGLGTIEKWLPIEHPHTGALLFVPTEILPEDIRAGSDNNVRNSRS